MYKLIETTIAEVLELPISNERKHVLDALVSYVEAKVTSGRYVNINFICTHNSRRSHLSQIWAQVAAFYYDIPKVVCYSGGTEATSMFPKIVETLVTTGFMIDKLADTSNPIYMVKFTENAPSVIGFSKVYGHPFNPVSEFVAIMTCSQADSGCPFIAGAEKRITIKFEDPKFSDGTPEQEVVYRECSLQIASEMFYVFSQIKQ